MSLDRQSIEAARTDVAVFADLLIGEPLWPHQLDLARSYARIRCVCSGRQAGKSRTLAVLSLHEAFARPATRVLIISAGEEAAKDLLSEISALAKSPLLTGSVLDDERHQINLTNGSSIRSVPASEKQVRGKSVDLLVIDEAAFVSEEIWTAARYTAVGRQGSRVVMASTPWGPKDRFFALTYRAGVRHEAGYESFRWPSTASPMVDAELLEMWRATSTDREYRREVLAEWVDSDGSYFTDAELESAISDYPLIPPENAQGRLVNGGVDWGFARDSSALILYNLLPISSDARRDRGEQDRIPSLAEDRVGLRDQTPGTQPEVCLLLNLARGNDLLRVLISPTGNPRAASRRRQSR
jgi:hypothetical protein